MPVRSLIGMSLFAPSLALADTLDSTPCATITGTSAAFGGSVSSAGDVDGDGFDDVIVGAYDEVPAGAAYVYRGSTSGLHLAAAWSFTGSSAQGMFGWSVASAGDVNDDGYGDVVIGAPLEASYLGEAYVFLGSSSGLATTPATVWTGTSSLLGNSVAGVGDVNHDGFDDVAVGIANWYGDWQVDLYLGSLTGMSNTASMSWNGPFGGDSLPYNTPQVSGAGDVNGDEIDDMLVAVGDAVFLYLGSATGPSDTPAATLSVGSYQASAVARTGDTNGDGYDDILVGNSGVGGYGYSGWSDGVAYLYEGAPSGISTDATAIWFGPSTGSALGRAVAGADLDGDGFGDVVIGAPGMNAQFGSTSSYSGSAEGTSLAPAVSWAGPEAYAHLGASVARAGDVNGDGADDVIVGGAIEWGAIGSAFLYCGALDTSADTGTPSDTGAPSDTGTPSDTNTGPVAESPVDDSGSGCSSMPWSPAEGMALAIAILGVIRRRPTWTATDFK